MKRWLYSLMGVVTALAHAVVGHAAPAVAADAASAANNENSQPHVIKLIINGTKGDQVPLVTEAKVEPTGEGVSIFLPESETKPRTLAGISPAAGQVEMKQESQDYE